MVVKNASSCTYLGINLTSFFRHTGSDGMSDSLSGRPNGNRPLKSVFLYFVYLGKYTEICNVVVSHVGCTFLLLVVVITTLNFAHVQPVISRLFDATWILQGVHMLTN